MGFPVSEGDKLWNEQHGTAVVVYVIGTGDGSGYKFDTDKGHAFYSDHIKGDMVRRNSSNDEWWHFTVSSPQTSAPEPPQHPQG